MIIKNKNALLIPLGSGIKYNENTQKEKEIMKLKSERMFKLTILYGMTGVLIA